MPAKKIAPYYVLAVREFGVASFAVQFGDYERETVYAELEELKKNEHLKPRELRGKFGVIRIKDDSQDSINAAVAELN